MALHSLGGTYTFAEAPLTVHRVGFGAMQLAGPGVYGPPKDPDTAMAVLREAVDAGVNHIDTSDFYGPHVTNELIRKALHPYPKGLVLVTKVGARRNEQKAWLEANSPEELTSAVHDNLRNLGLDTLDVVNYRVFGHGLTRHEISEPVSLLAELQHKGLIRHIGMSNATVAQIAAAQKIVKVVCVQNQYNLAHREDDALVEDLARQGIPYVPFFPLGGFTSLQSQVLEDVAAQLGRTPMQIALAWLLQRSPNILLIPGTSSLGHLRENLSVAEISLSPETVTKLDQIAEDALPVQH